MKLLNIRKTRIDIRPREALDETARAAMWALYAPHHAVDRAEFDEKLAGLDEIALFTSRADGRLVGFCGLRFRLFPAADGRRFATFYMGLTFIERRWRAHALIPRMVVRRMLGPWALRRYDGVYFWSDCLTYRPYLVMSRNLREYYPSRHRETPPEIRALITAIGRAHYGDDFDAARGVVHKAKVALDPSERVISGSDLVDPDIRFYLERNSGYSRGDGMLALCPGTLGNVVHFVSRRAGAWWREAIGVRATREATR